MKVLLIWSYSSQAITWQINIQQTIPPIQTYYTIQILVYTKDFLKEHFTQKYKSEVTQDEFVSLLDQIWRNHYISCSIMDPL